MLERSLGSVLRPMTASTEYCLVRGRSGEGRSDQDRLTRKGDMGKQLRDKLAQGRSGDCFHAGPCMPPMANAINPFVMVSTFDGGHSIPQTSMRYVIQDELRSLISRSTRNLRYTYVSKQSTSVMMGIFADLLYARPGL